MTLRTDRHVRRRRLAILVALAGLGLVGVVLLPGGGPRRAATDSPASATTRVLPAQPTSVATTRPTAATTRTTVIGTVPAVTSDAGQLPQTTAFPSSATPQFAAEMADLWQGVVTGSEAPALPAFFPEAAYLQLKAIFDAKSDYVDRLLSDYAADLAAAHQLLGSSPASARLVAVDVPATFGHWVPPGVCDNRVGYYEVPNSRVVYQVSGQTRSFGIASMISWRGTWYVVHLGAILRSSSQGVVDDPEIGPGAPAYSSTC
jgi:hypothetical protein